jgi:UDPglucose--hexose-1-phosphate uridylyltransferase
MSEFRENITSDEWVIISENRNKRPVSKSEKRKRIPAPKAGCPFENLQKTGNWPPILLYPNEKKWQIVLLPNKYPALDNNYKNNNFKVRGIYRSKAGTGYHDLIITRDHYKNFAEIDKNLAHKVFDIFKERHLEMRENKNNVYTSTFCNWGQLVGSSIWHPHYQMLTLPIIPPKIVRSLSGSLKYFKENKRCVRCDIIKEEKKYKKRIIAENNYGIAFTPYASRTPFEVSIFPKKHISAFSETPQDVLYGMADLLQIVLRMIKKRLNDPDFNFFIHGSPFDDKKYFYHHWHVEVLPRISLFGGFEYSTDIDINTVDPDTAAKILRGEK